MMNTVRRHCGVSAMLALSTDVITSYLLTYLLTLPIIAISLYRAAVLYHLVRSRVYTARYLQLGLLLFFFFATRKFDGSSSYQLAVVLLFYIWHPCQQVVIISAASDPKYTAFHCRRLCKDIVVIYFVCLLVCQFVLLCV